jgi:hypothetical protein
MEIAGLLGPIIREEKPAKVNIDVGGLGIGIYERLIEQGYDSSVVTAVNFGGKPLEPPPLDDAGRPGEGACKPSRRDVVEYVKVSAGPVRRSRSHRLYRRPSILWPSS